MLLALFFFLMNPQGQVRPFDAERLLLDRRLETLRRILPDGPSPTLDAALVKELGERARLPGVEALARPPVETGSRGQVGVDLTAHGRYADVERFFRQVALSPRLMDVESLSLSAGPDGSVRLAAVLLLPYRPLRAALPGPPEGTRTRVSGLPRAQADAFLRDQALAVAKAEAIASARRARRSPRLFLSELAAIVRDRPVVLRSASLAEEFSVSGLAVGEGPIRALESRFERGFFRLSAFTIVRQGSCLRFEAKGRSPDAGPEAELPLPTEDPFEQDGAPCRVDRDPGKATALKSPAAKAPARSPAAQGSITLRLRDVDLTDVFRALHAVTSQGFLVDGDVVGRVSLDLSRVTLEEALAFLAKGAGLRVAPPGPVRRVSRARTEVPRDAAAHASPPAPPESPRASFAVKRAEVRDILAVISEADPSFAALGPQGFLGRASVWANDAPVPALRAAVLESAGLEERVEDGRRILERRGGSTDAPVPVAGAIPEPRLVLQPQDLTFGEFELAGLASGGSGWIAFAYAPAGALNAYRSGERLADAEVRAVESTDVLLETEEGPLRLGPAPLPR